VLRRIYTIALYHYYLITLYDIYLIMSRESLGFCAEEDAVVRVDPAGACSNTEAGIRIFNPLYQ
jgi:hypothetical protein